MVFKPVTPFVRVSGAQSINFVFVVIQKLLEEGLAVGDMIETVWGAGRFRNLGKRTPGINNQANEHKMQKYFWARVSSIMASHLLVMVHPSLEGPHVDGDDLFRGEKIMVDVAQAHGLALSCMKE